MRPPPPPIMGEPDGKPSRLIPRHPPPKGEGKSFGEERAGLSSPPELLAHLFWEGRRLRRGGFRLPQNWGQGGIFLLILCAGCAPHSAAPPAEARNPKLNLALDIRPRSVRSLDPIALTVRVTDVAGKPVRGAVVTLRLDMPAMPMGDNGVTTREMAAGIYAGTGRFTMAGAWRVTASAAKGPERAVRAFPVEVR